MKFLKTLKIGRVGTSQDVHKCKMKFNLLTSYCIQLRKLLIVTRRFVTLIKTPVKY